MKTAPSGAVFMRRALDDAGLLEGGVCTVLLYVTHAVCRNVYKNGFAELCDEDTTLLKIRLTTDLSSWVELRSTRPV